LVLVDVTPGVDAAKAGAVAFTSGPERFASFDAILDRTIVHNPNRSADSLRRGVIHNAHELPGGSWAWRWDPHGAALPVKGDPAPALHGLWDVLAALPLSLTLVRGGRSAVVDDADVVELLRRRADAEVLVVEGAGHSVQGDRPIQLAEILAQRWPR
jgi:pimeloyl-ACP methyl ester carboxylesterase